MTDPRPLREHDSLGRAGRVSTKGNRIETERAREIAPEDSRRTAIEVVGFEDPRLVIVTPPPLTDENGKPLPVVQEDDHPSLLHLDGKGEVRPPKTWEEMNAAKRAAVGASEREALLRSLRRERSETSLEQRIATLRARRLLMQSQRAKRIAATDADARAGSAEQHNLPSGDGHGALAYFDEAEIDGHWQQIELHIEKLELAQDAADGLVQKNPQMMSTEEKDRLLVGPKFRGRSPEEIIASHPELGPARAIQRARAAADQDKYGNERPVREDAPGRQAWTAEQDTAVMAGERSDTDLAEEYGRTVNSIRVRRVRLRDRQGTAA